MAFSIFVEALNIGARRKKSTPPVQLHDTMHDSAHGSAQPSAK
jgi:hypothetical protein